jgi:hypothetical protein
LDGELLAGDHGTAIPQVCGPDRGLQEAVGISSEELVIVRRDIFGRPGILGNVEEFLLERIEGGRRCR